MLLKETTDTAYITPKGLAKIENELVRLRDDRRIEIIERLHESMAGGDSIDNTE